MTGWQHTLVATILALATAQGALAGPDPAAAAEIDYLLDYVGHSGCQFYRNGAWHDPAAAQEHLRDKYEALAARGQVVTADEFIEKVATKSMLSGKAYKVKCAVGQEIPTSEWLAQALARHRAKSAQGMVAPAVEHPTSTLALIQSTSLIGGSPAMCMVPSSIRTSASLLTS